MANKTPLYQVHLDEGGKIVEFAGYELPVQYATGVKAEHLAVRTACGLFDVSHMGEFLVTGPQALTWLNLMLCNSFTSLQPGRVRYSPMCFDHGGCIDDVLVCCRGENSYYLVVNAANRSRDFQWLQEHLTDGVELADVSDHIAQLALQGPNSRPILEKLMAAGDIPEKYYSFSEGVSVGGIPALVSRTGYTGELGYELYVKANHGPDLWRKLREAGAGLGLIPCGLGARDTLRFEAGMPLYGHELTEDITPLEAGLDFAVKLDKDFLGREAMVAKGRPRVRVGLQVTGRGVIREHQDVYLGDKLIGHTTSGTFCPYLDGAYAMALVPADTLSLGDRVEADVRGRRVEAQVVALPFYSAAK